MGSTPCDTEAMKIKHFHLQKVVYHQMMLHYCTGTYIHPMYSNLLWMGLGVMWHHTQRKHLMFA